MKAYLSPFFLAIALAYWPISAETIAPVTTDVALPPKAEHSMTSKKPPNLTAANEGIAFFTPPENWHLVDKANLSPSVKIMVVGDAKSAFPPSINMSSQPYDSSLKQYLKMVKQTNDAKGYEWKDLGTIKTEAGNASLSQVDTQTQWGTVRLMHVILKKNGFIYILTASATADEFSFYYKDFFASMRSLRIVKDPLDVVSDKTEKKKLKSEVASVQKQWNKMVIEQQHQDVNLSQDETKNLVFNQAQFQDMVWKPFQEALDTQFAQFGAEWKNLLLNKVKSDLFSVDTN